MLSDRDIQHIVARIVAGCGPIAAGTFGSYAVGLARQSSDLDLFVIQRTTLPMSARRRSIYRQVFGVMHRLDIHVFTPEEFEADAREELSFAWIIARQARLYYWTMEAARVVPALRAGGSRSGAESQFGPSKAESGSNQGLLISRGWPTADCGVDPSKQDVGSGIHSSGHADVINGR